MQSNQIASTDFAGAPTPARGRLWSAAQVLADIMRRGPQQRKPPTGRVFDHAAVRYLLAGLFVIVAEVSSFGILTATGRFQAFPFYAAVVGGAWLGIGPGCLSFVLSAILAADFWTPKFLDWSLTWADIPSFIGFVLFALMSLAWSAQRGRAERVMEATIAERTADLVRTNAALQVEIAERAAAEEERRRTERALREAEAELARTLRLATVAELAAAIAHEINQPLAAIVANGAACSRSLAQQPPLLDNAREAASCIVADGHRAGDVIARIRSLFNKEPPQWRALDINQLIRQVLELARGPIERQRVAMHAELMQPLPPVMGDPVQLQQVLVNLVTNALEAMAADADGGRRIAIRSRVDDGAAVVVTVEDTGAGLDPEQLAHIFDSFYTTKPGGIGVGLAISRSIVEAHGGSLWAVPGDSGGARFGITLPLAPAGQPQPGA